MSHTQYWFKMNMDKKIIETLIKFIINKIKRSFNYSVSKVTGP